MRSPRVANWLSGVFYVAVAGFALVGGVIASASWLDWQWPVRAGLIAVFELGGAALAAYADHRRRLGESAYLALGISGGIAAAAVTLQWVGHTNHIAGGVFASLSAVGYGFWLIFSNARRRDALRESGDLPPKAPKYGAYWVTNPVLTRRARQLALESGDLGLYASLHAAREEKRVNASKAELRVALAVALSNSVEDAYQAIALNAHDLDVMVDALRRGVDNEARAAQLLERINPAVVARARTVSTPRAPRVSDTSANASKPSVRARLATQAERAYETYATAIDQGLPELDGPALRALLGVKTTGAARSARIKWRGRYADEVAAGKRARVSGAPLPDAIAGAFAARKAASELAGELNIITNRGERS